MTATQRIRISAFAATATIGLAATMLAGAAPASAGAGLLPSATTLSAVMTPDGSGLAVTSTVKVPIVGVGLGLTPTGTVTFTDDHGDVLGAVKMASCLLKACTVHDTLPTSAFGASANGVVATYSGDVLLGSSSASVPVLYDRCTTGKSCTSGEISDGTTSVIVGVPVGDTALVTLGGTALPCSIGSGAVVNLATTGSSKSIQLAIGEAGTTYATLDTSIADSGAGHSFYRCAASTLPFTAFSPAVGGSYTRTASDFATYAAAPTTLVGGYSGDHVGLLADCFYLVTHTVGGGACENSATTSVTTLDATDIVVTAVNGVTHFAG
jgi:hypothetical protein